MSRGIRTGLLFILSAMLVLGLEVAGAAGAPPQKAPATYFVYIATRADGIYGYRFTVATGQYESLGNMAKLDQPTWLALSPDGSVLYTTSEVGNDGKAEGSLISLRRDPQTGKLQLLNKVPAGGGGTTHISLGKTGGFLLAANYGNGQVVDFRINNDGSVGQRTSLIQHSGDPGSHSHTHQIVLAPDGRYAIVPDLGLDRVYSYKVDPKTGALTAGTPAFVQLPAGVQPRHFTFHPNGRYAYLIEQHGANIVAFSYSKATGMLKPIQTISTLPDNFTGTPTGAEVWVEPSGRFLYAASRSDDTLLVYSIDPLHGTLTEVQRIGANGRSPRFITPDPTGKVLLLANALSNQIVFFNIDPVTGKLSPKEGPTLTAPIPAHILFVPAE